MIDSATFPANAIALFGTLRYNTLFFHIAKVASSIFLKLMTSGPQSS